MPAALIEERELTSWMSTRESSSGNSIGTQESDRAEVPERSRGEMKRRALIARQFRRMAVSSHQPVPGQERMLLLVEDAYRLWQGIPEAELSAAVEEAAIRSGSFMPTAGLVVQCWRAQKEKHPDLGSGTKKSESETRVYLDWLRKAEAEKASPEFVSQFCREIVAQLAGKNVPC